MKFSILGRKAAHHLAIAGLIAAGNALGAPPVKGSKKPAPSPSPTASPSPKPSPSPSPIASPTPISTSGSTPIEKYYEDDFTGTYITGTHINKTLGGWTLGNHPLVTWTGFNNSASTSAYAFQSIVPDPVGTGRSVLYAQTIDKDPTISATTRAQMTINFVSTDIGIYHTRHRMYFHPDLAELRNYEGRLDWFTIFEVYNAPNPAWDGDPAGSARWSLSIFKNTGAGQPLVWKLNSDYRQPLAVQTQPLFPGGYNTTIPIPFGQWVTLDFYLKRGEGTDGHIVITLTPDGGSAQTIFDGHGPTMYPGHPELAISAWQPFKLYTSDTIMDWMRARGKKIAAYYNDFIWFMK